MPSLTLQSEVTVLLKRAPTEKFVPLTVLDTEHGSFVVHQRTGSRQKETALDLFDEAEVIATSSNQGQTWFVSEARPRVRRTGIGRGYDSLREASRFAEIVARNPVSEEERGAVVELVRQALDAFDRSPAAPEVVRLKALYSFAKIEGYPVRQHWIDGLSSSLRPVAEHILRTPLAQLSGAAPLKSDASRLNERLESYLRAHTEILLD